MTDTFFLSDVTKKVDNMNSLSSVLKNMNASINCKSLPEEFCSWEPVNVMSKSELDNESGYVTETPFVSLTDSQSSVIPSDNISISEEVPLICNTCPKTVGNQMFDSPLGDSEFEQDRPLDCIWETRKSLSPSDIPTTGTCAKPCTDASVKTVNCKTLQLKPKLGKRKRRDSTDVTRADGDNSLIESKTVGKDGSNILPVLTSNVSVLNQDNVESSAICGGTSTAASICFSVVEFSGDLLPPCAVERDTCVWEMMCQDFSPLAKSSDKAAVHNGLIDTIMTEEGNLFSSQLQSITNVVGIAGLRNDVDVGGTDKRRSWGNNTQESGIGNFESIPPAFQFDPAMLELGFETNVPSRPTIQKRRRKSVSADQEIATQLFNKNSLECHPSPSESGFGGGEPTGRRYPQRLRRRSTELMLFAKRKVEAESPSVLKCGSDNVEPMSEFNAFRIVSPENHDASLSESFTSIVESGISSSAQMQQSALNEKLASKDVEISEIMQNSELLSAPAAASKKSRRRSTELCRTENSNQHGILLSGSHEASETLFVSEGDEASILPQRLSKQKCIRVYEPPLEDIYLNKLWRTQMPKESSWETIHEDPKINKNTGNYKLFSKSKSRRFFKFEEGPSPLHLRLRKQKAIKLGWKPITKKKDLKLKKLLLRKLSQLDEELKTTTTES